MVKYISLLFVCCFLSCKEDKKLPDINGKDIEKNYSGTGFVGNFHIPDAKVLFKINISSSREYSIEFRYLNTIEEEATASLYINDRKQEQLKFPFITLDEWQTLSYKTFLEEGLLFLSLQHDNEDNGLFLLDYILLK